VLGQDLPEAFLVHDRGRRMQPLPGGRTKPRQATGVEGGGEEQLVERRSYFLSYIRTKILFCVIFRFVIVIIIRIKDLFVCFSCVLFASSLFSAIANERYGNPWFKNPVSRWSYARVKSLLFSSFEQSSNRNSNRTPHRQSSSLILPVVYY